MTDRDKRIQEIAYQLWVKEDRPDGRSDSHYFEAVELYEVEIAQGKNAEAEPPAAPVAEKPAPRAEPVAEKPAARAEPVAEKPAPRAEPVAEKPTRPGGTKTAEPTAGTAGKKTTAEPIPQKPASASKPKPAEPAGKPAPSGRARF